MVRISCLVGLFRLQLFEDFLRLKFRCAHRGTFSGGRAR